MQKVQKTAAYETGIKLALENAGLIKTAIDPSVLQGVKRLFGGAQTGMKDFFTARRVREALRNLGEAGETGGSKLTEQGQFLLELPGAVGKTPIQMGRQDVFNALKPYGAAAGLGGAAALTPGIISSMYPDLGEG